MFVDFMAFVYTYRKELGYLYGFADISGLRNHFPGGRNLESVDLHGCSQVKTITWFIAIQDLNRTYSWGICYNKQAHKMDSTRDLYETEHYDST